MIKIKFLFGQIKLNYALAKFAVGIAVAIISFAGISLGIRIPSAQSEVSTVQFNRPPLSPRGAPGDRTGGGTRDGISCPALDTEQFLTALVPQFKQLEITDKKPKREITHVWGLTAQKSPTFWFYLPYLSKDVSLAQFELWDETDPNLRNYQLIYEGSFTLIGTPGVISLSLPPNVKLESNKNYHWYLSVTINCDFHNVSVNVNGWIQRVKKIVMPLESAADRELVMLLAQNGIWYDALTLLAQLHTNNPTNPTFTADWETLLEFVNLKTLAQKKIIPCCPFHHNSLKGLKRTS